MAEKDYRVTLTVLLFQKLWPRCPPDRVAALANAIRREQDNGGLTTPERLGTFMGQMGWECNYGRAMLESKETAEAYEGRLDLGNTEWGDGVRYRGRGIIHLTGRSNYRRYGRLTGFDLEARPELAAEPHVAVKVAIAYWTERSLNKCVDAGDHRMVTKRINGACTDEYPSWHKRRMQRVDRCIEILTKRRKETAKLLDPL